MENNSGCHITIGGWFVSVLTLIFVVAKLLVIVDWSWWLVFSPLIASFGFCVLILIIIALLYLWTQW